MIDKDHMEVQAYPHSMFGVKATVPLTVELPPALVQLLRWHYERAAECDDPNFADYICDVVVFDLTYYVNSVELDEHTGRPVDEGNE